MHRPSSQSVPLWPLTKRPATTLRAVRNLTRSTDTGAPSSTACSTIPTAASLLRLARYVFVAEVGQIETRILAARGQPPPHTLTTTAAAVRRPRRCILCQHCACWFRAALSALCRSHRWMQASRAVAVPSCGRAAGVAGAIPIASTVPGRARQRMRFSRIHPSPGTCSALVSVHTLYRTVAGVDHARTRFNGTKAATNHGGQGMLPQVRRQRRCTSMLPHLRQHVAHGAGQHAQRWALPTAEDRCA